MILITDNLRTFLQENSVLFEIIHHEKPLRTAQEGADYFGIELGQTAPTLIIKSDSDEGYFALIVSGGRGRINMDEVSDIIGCVSSKLATPKEVQEITGYAVGSVPLVGLSLSCIVDRELFRYPFIYGGTGEQSSTLKINPTALETLNRVVALLD